MSYSILLIEDNIDMGENIVSILQLAHYNVRYATDGKKGVELAQESPPDLILCDIMMPELDGYGVFHILNHNPDTADIPFIFLTAKADRSDFREGMNLGADDYMTKPFDGIDLLRVVEMRISKRKRLHEDSSDRQSYDLNRLFNNAKESREFQKLSDNRPTKTFKKKDLIFMEGQNPNNLFYIKSGKVKTYKLNYDGKEFITGIHSAGDFLGYVPLLEEKPYNENAEVLEDVKVTIIPKSEFVSLVYSSRDVARKFIQMLSNNLDEMEDRLVDIAYQSVRQRVANALLKINEKHVGSNQEALITFARKDISNLVGTATESLNRTLAEFRDSGYIEISENGLKIINKPKLEQLIR